MDITVAFHPEVHHTSKGTPYLREPGVVLLAEPSISLENMSGFLDGFDPELGFRDFEHDTPLPPAEALCKTAGQLCYMSLGPKRTKNIDATTYFRNIKASGHGSVMEHANFTLLLYGIDRSVTHELVRHRAGFAFSQVSQRYVNGKVLRFVERPEFQTTSELHEAFCRRIDLAAVNYEVLADQLRASIPYLDELAKRDGRKAINQSARACLPNETEAPIVVTANIRAWRHFIEMRASEHAEILIRAAAVWVYRILRASAPRLFEDYTEVTALGGPVVKTEWRKV